MTSAGTVTVDFAAETAKFTAELKKVNDRLKGMEGGFESVSRLARNFLPVVSVGAVAAFARSAFEAADALGDTAKVIGVNVESLSRLKFAADQNDVEFQSLSTSLTRYQKNLSEANHGNKAAAAMFDSLGLSASALRGLKLEDQLGQIADRFKLITDPADRTRVAMELFGKSGAELIPLLQGGSEGLKEWANQADRLGITLTQSAAAGIDALDAAWKRFTKSASGVGGNLIGGIGLAIFGTDDQMVNTQQQLQKLQILKAQIAATPGGASTPAFGNLEKEISALESRLKNLTDLKNGLQPASAGQNSSPLSEVSITGAAAVGQKERSGWDVVDEADAQRQQEFADMRQAITLQSLETTNALTLQSQRELGDKMNAEIESQLQQEAALRDYYGQQNYQREAAAEASMLALKKATLSNVMGALQSFAGQNKKVAIALVAIQKAHALQQAIQLGHVSIAQASASPYPANIPAIAWAKAFMVTNVAAIAATGIGQIASINAGSGPGASLGSPANPVFTDSGRNAAGEDDRTFGASSQRVTEVHVHGNLFSNRETADWLIEQISGAVNDRDVVFIRGNSLQADTILKGYS